ncbi:hypothetical protein BH23VER1_BH23VER1_18270 [soil metagenome]
MNFTTSPRVFESTSGFRSPGPQRVLPLGKRLFDCTVVLLSLPLWLPVVLVVAAWVKLASRGPLFFRQERVGLGGNPFTMLKFRSMKCGADTVCHAEHVARLIASDQPMTKLDVLGDSRLIPGGYLIRALGLDELPQLWNVLAGEMSLVGPRPCTLNELSVYGPDQYERFGALPGLTGFWQVSGKNRTTFKEMVAMDIDYVRHHGPFLDCAILMQTVPSILLQLAQARSGMPARKPDSPMPHAAPVSERRQEMTRDGFQTNGHQTNGHQPLSGRSKRDARHIIGWNPGITEPNP